VVAREVTQALLQQLGFLGELRQQPARLLDAGADRRLVPTIERSEHVREPARTAGLEGQRADPRFVDLLELLGASLGNQLGGMKIVAVAAGSLAQAVS
jgi:hypothetical protein